MSDIVVQTLMQSVTGIIVAFIGIASYRQSKRNKRILYQVENEHRKPDGTPINLREEQDDRHEEIKESMSTIRRLLMFITGDVQELRKDFSNVSVTVAKNSGKIEALEDMIRKSTKGNDRER